MEGWSSIEILKAVKKVYDWPILDKNNHHQMW